jgi:hypothetical protein
MAGFFSNGVCFPTVEQATDNYYQNLSSFGSTGSQAYIFQYVKTNGTWVLKRSNNDGFNSININLTPLSLLECESHTDTETQFLNGMELGWGVASVVVIAFVLRRLRRGF